MRPAVLDVDGVGRDVGYIVSTWVESSAAQLGAMTGARVKDWRAVVLERMSSDLRRNAVAVACDAEDEDRLYGWACGSPGKLVYVYVRDTRRRMGIASELVAAVCGERPKRCTWLTPGAQLIALRHGIEWKP